LTFVAPRRPADAARHEDEAIYTLNGELYKSQWFASEALARADLATQQDALAGRRLDAGPVSAQLIVRCTSHDRTPGWLQRRQGGDQISDSWGPFRRNQKFTE
jgi:hypothetical protein